MAARHNKTIPAITLWQPWASLISRGFKRIETRTHARFRSLVGQRIAIHAGCQVDWEAWLILEWNAPDEVGDLLREKRVMSSYRRKPYSLLPSAAIVATAWVVEHRKLGRRDAEAALVQDPAGLYGLVLEDVQPIDPPIKRRGRQGIWRWRMLEEART